MKTKTCPVCNADNAMNSLVCVNCGATFSSGDTLQVNAIPTEPAHHAQIEQITRTYGDSVIIFVEGNDQPIIVPQKQSKITLGRLVAGHEAPTVDLMNYGASNHGVSRMHVAVYFTEHGYLLQDMDSTNGTWLNGIRLIQNTTSSLQSGDHLRLGEMSMFIYFSTPHENGEQTLVLYDPDLGTDGLTPDYLIDEVCVLFSELARLQQLIDEYEGTENKTAKISSIVASRQQQTITTSVENLSGAIKAWREQILPWKQEYTDLIEHPSSELDEAIQVLSSQIIDTFDPDEEAILIPRLLPIINTLITLTITDDAIRKDTA